MSSTNKTSLGLNMWEASDKPVRQDFVNDNVIIDEKISELDSNLVLKANASDLANINSNLTGLSNGLTLTNISSSFTTNSTYVTSFSAYKFGKVIFISGALTTSIPTGSITNIANIANTTNSNYYPIAPAVGYDATIGSTAEITNRCNIMLNTDGKLWAIAPNTLAAAKRFSAVYFIA